MPKYKINFSALGYFTSTIEADSFQEAMNVFYDGEHTPVMHELDEYDYFDIYETEVVNED